MAKKTEFAGFWKRFAAGILDNIIYLVGLIVIGIVLFGVGSLLPEMLRGFVILLFILVFVASQWLYFALFECSKYQATPGKLILGIKVTDLNGNRIGFGRATGRFFAKIVSELTLKIGYLMIGFTEKKQGLHDMIAGCLVVDQ